MLVLLTEAEPGDAAAAAHILGAAGHTLSYCHPPWIPTARVVPSLMAVAARSSMTTST